MGATRAPNIGSAGAREGEGGRRVLHLPQESTNRRVESVASSSQHPRPLLAGRSSTVSRQAPKELLCDRGIRIRCDERLKLPPSVVQEAISGVDKAQGQVGLLSGSLESLEVR